MSESVINVGGVLSVYSDCITCGIRYTVPKAMWDKQRQDGGFHRCPNGHSQGWTPGKNTEFDRMKRERDRAVQEQARLAQEASEAQQRATKAETSERRLRKRIYAGVCPCCKRTFRNLASHIETKHPDQLRLLSRH